MSLPNTFKQKVVMERLISRACFASSETLKHASVSFLSFFFRVCAPKGCSWSQEFLAESVEHGDKNGRVTKAMHTKLRQY